jgi:response regulator RpfG family c-di-GMP phosphodiesterase
MDGLKNATCLIVDDQERLRQALVRKLQWAGMQCREASSGGEALRALEAERADVLISDIQMPEMSGVELLTTVRERWPDIAAIMVTGVDDVATAVSCLQLGAFDYITKPFQLDEVQARVERALEKRRLLLENRTYQDRLAELVQHQAQRIEELFLEGVQTLVQALEAKDAYTRGHSARVSAYSRAIAQRLAVHEADVQMITLGAELHDVGKIGVREEVLRKAGALTAEEYAHIMEHTVIGERILAPLLKHAPAVLSIVRSHHERWDGHGLPDGAAGDAISMHARVVSVADAFDAMTSGRPYRAGRPVDVALAELQKGSGVQFDPDVVAAFRSAYQDPGSLPITTPSGVMRHSLPIRVAAGDATLAAR